MRKSITTSTACGAWILAACGGATKSPAEVRATIYRADIVALYDGVSAEVRQKYPHVVEYPSERAIKTAWHPLPLKEVVQSRNTEAGYPERSEQAEAPVTPGPAGQRKERHRHENRIALTTRSTRYFIRFVVRLEPAAARPGADAERWMVVVSGEASVWDNRGVPVPLKGSEVPYWVEKRKENLERAIYSRLRATALATAKPAKAAP